MIVDCFVVRVTTTAHAAVRVHREDVVMTIAEAVSFALGAASILLGVLAIWLSIHFYTRDQALFVETQRTLADIQHTARSVEHATELVLAKAISSSSQ